MTIHNSSSANCKYYCPADSTIACYSLQIILFFTDTRRDITSEKKKNKEKRKKVKKPPQTKKKNPTHQKTLNILN